MEWLISTCCRPGRVDDASASACPVSGSRGVAVERGTVKALLTERALARLQAGDYRFCPDPGCDVVYFTLAGQSFVTADVRVPVWQKQPAGSRILCYCFGESEASIRSELEAAGTSRAAERIRDHISADRCACEMRNPRGVCCLGDVTAAVKRAGAARASGRDAE